MPKYKKFFSTPHSPHVMVVNLIGKKKKVLDVGCATGYISKKMKENGCEVVGIEIDKESGEIARKHCRDVIIADVEDLKKLPYRKGFFDVILFSDILEHLKNPFDVLRKFRRYLSDDGYIVVAVPNVAFWFFRLKLLFGKFQYKEYGTFDKTHLKFFTLKTIKELLKDSGYKITKIDVTPRCIFPPIDGLLYLIAKLWKALFAYEFIIVAGKGE